ncbi:MAG: YbjN domain-containing protein [Polyangiaceae bacterium]
MSDSQATPEPAPVYADRETGENFPDAMSMVNAYLARFSSRAGLTAEDGGAITPQLDESGYAQVQRGSAVIGVNVLEMQGVLMVFSPIMPVPLAGREAFYRKLLELSFVQTSDAAFAVNADQDEVVVRSLRRLSGLDYEEFEDILATVGEVADRWDDELIRDWGD